MFSGMNKTFFYLFCAAVVGLLPTHAKESVEATTVHVSLTQGKAAATLEASPLSAPPTGNIFKDMKGTSFSALKIDDKPMWHVVNIPITVTARGKTKDGDKAAANYISELRVTAYLLYRAPEPPKQGKSSSKSADSDAKKFCLIEKTMTFVDIPLDTKSGKREAKEEVGYTEMSVGLFIPRSEAYKITGSDDPASEMVKSGRFVAYAVEASFRGAPCRKVEISGQSSTSAGLTPNSKVFDNKLKKDVGTATWWKGKTREHFTATDAKVLCISETPFAPFYSSFYPATRPLYGAPDVGEATSTTTTDPTLAPVTESTSDSSTSSSSTRTRSAGSADATGGSDI